MSCRDLFVLACALCWSCFVDVPSPAHGQTTDLKASDRNVLTVSGPKVYGVKSLVKIDASMNGKQVVDQEAPGFGMGIVISDGMLVTSYPVSNLYIILKKMHLSMSLRFLRRKK